MNENYHEDIEYYDMEAFEKRLNKRLDKLEHRIDIILEEAEDNNKRIKGIQFGFARSRIIRLIRLGIIALIFWYLYSTFISPIVSTVGDTYYRATNLLDRVDGASQETQETRERLQNFIPDFNAALERIRPSENESSN